MAYVVMFCIVLCCPVMFGTVLCCVWHKPLSVSVKICAVVCCIMLFNIDLWCLILILAYNRPADGDRLIEYAVLRCFVQRCSVMLYSVLWLLPPARRLLCYAVLLFSTIYSAVL